MKLLTILCVLIDVSKSGGLIFLEYQDKKLIGLCKKGKREGYELLFEKYKNYIYKICYHYSVSREDALDLMQEIYIKLYRSIDGFDENKPLLPWIKRITVNTCLNFVRDRKDSTVSFNTSIDDNDTTVEDLLASTENVEDEVDFMDTKKLIEDSIKLLPGEMKMAVILKYINRLSYDDISKLMGCPMGTVKTYIFRGRKILKEKLKAAGVWEV